MPETTGFDYFLIGLIIVIVLVLLFQVSSSGSCRSREFMNDTNSKIPCEYKLDYDDTPSEAGLFNRMVRGEDVSLSNDAKHLMDDVQNNRVYEKLNNVAPEEPKLAQLYDKMVRGQCVSKDEIDMVEFDRAYDFYNPLYKNLDTPLLRKGTNCPVSQMEKETDIYLRDLVLGGQFTCPTVSGKKYSAEEINKYQDRFFGFYNDINQSSNEELGPDMVDKMNEWNVVRGNEMAPNGETVAQVYDNLTQNNLNKNHNCQTCRMPPKIDWENCNNTDSKLGNFYSRCGVNYDYENVNNGGRFFENVEGSDDRYVNQMPY